MATSFERLLWARQYLGLSIEVVSECTGLTCSRLAALEEAAVPTEAELRCLSNLYKFPEGFLAGKDDLKRGPVQAVHRAPGKIAAQDEKELEIFSSFLMAAEERGN